MKLKSFRKLQGLSQSKLAQKVGIGLSTLQNLENGKGEFYNFLKVISMLGLELRGRNLRLKNTTIFEAIVILRKRQKWSRRALANTLNIHPDTLAKIEQGKNCQLGIFLSVVKNVGAGLYLEYIEVPHKFYNHAGNSSLVQDWTTPPELLEKLYSIYGVFDLDPCSPKKTVVKAKRHLTILDDGLTCSWHGKVFVNPPYGRSIGLWVKKCFEESHNPNTIIVALLPSRTDTKWRHDYIMDKAKIEFLRGRLKFGDGSNSAPFPSVLIVWDKKFSLAQKT